MTITCNSGGPGSSPGGVSGNLQTNNGSGGFGAYAGTGAAPTDQWLRSLNASGVATWGQIDWTNISGKPGTFYTLPAATATVLGGVKGTGTALVCSGTNKVTGFASDGTLQCDVDQTGGGGGAPTTSTYTTVTDETTTLTNSRRWVNGANTTVDTGTAGQIKLNVPAAPTDLSGEGFWVKTASGNLSNEIALGSLSGGLVINTTTTGMPTIYGGTGSAPANQWLRQLDGSGVATWAQIDWTNVSGKPTIPADISGAHYVTTQVEGGLSAEAVVPTCTGTDKLTFNGTTLSCAADQTGGTGSSNFVEVDVDFGTDSTDATTVVTGQAWVTGTSKIMCAPTLLATSTRGEGDEDALLEGLEGAAYNRSAGDGFTLRAAVTSGGTNGVYKFHCTGG
jgi:hypothetical protein